MNNKDKFFKELKQLFIKHKIVYCNDVIKFNHADNECYKFQFSLSHTSLNPKDENHHLFVQTIENKMV